MFTTDHFDGSIEGYETKIDHQPDGTWKASALGLDAIHADQGQALNDLNEKIFNAVSRGELTPNMGN